jgi:hypothetical protein
MGGWLSKDDNKLLVYKNLYNKTEPASMSYSLLKGQMLASWSKTQAIYYKR